MFRICDFKGDISNLDMSNVTNTFGMFGGSTFNGYIGDWNMRNVICADEMFEGSVNFNGDISKWELPMLVSAKTIFGKYCLIENKHKPKKFR